VLRLRGGTGVRGRRRGVEGAEAELLLLLAPPWAEPASGAAGQPPYAERAELLAEAQVAARVQRLRGSLVAALRTGEWLGLSAEQRTVQLAALYGRARALRLQRRRERGVARGSGAAGGGAA
jgi:hypothetical protein